LWSTFDLESESKDIRRITWINAKNYFKAVWIRIFSSIFMALLSASAVSERAWEISQMRRKPVINRFTRPAAGPNPQRDISNFQQSGARAFSLFGAFL
jgi:hypothetical protein